MWCKKYVPRVHSEPLPTGALVVKCAKCKLLGKIPIPSLADREYFRERHHKGLEYTGSATTIWAQGSDPQSLIRPACVFCGVSLPDDRLLCALCHMEKEMTIERLRWSKVDIASPVPRCRDAREASRAPSVEVVSELGWC